MNREEYFEVCNLVCRKLEDRLHEKIRGYVKVRVEDDHLVIRVRRFEESNTFEYKVDGSFLYDHVLYGCNYDKILDDFTRLYRKYILGGYFYL